MSDQTSQPTPESQPLVASNTGSIGFRLTQALFWLVLLPIVPIYMIVMIFMALFGSAERAHNMALTLDETGNALLGGAANQTFSARTGDAWIQGKRWGKIVGPIIDFFFGKGHCLSNVDLPESELTAEQIAEVNAADAEYGDTPTYPDAQ